ncbi:EsaB/YukD family protein [Actinomycetospora endophytica]|uniref:EsaB/YukD family protein n=1 Tax=Actinomycetospora endophytica TaxID=2291215 RepID=A0ABS8P200_9PSEU|nr:EsaB/YukD family protein [Actinomycetospora endophytica]MCD2192258.1 EsaB/YukD family protein [Actinomycetospora endophytica]
MAIRHPSAGFRAAAALDVGPRSAAEPGPSGRELAPGSDGGWCTVRVRGPEGTVDAALPATATVAEVVEELAGRLLPGAPLVRGADGRPWYLHRTGAGPLPPGISLQAAGVRDGDVLHLGPWPMPRPAQAVDDGLVALADGSSRVPRWTPHRAGVLVTTLLVALATLAAALSLALPAGPLVAVVLAGTLLGLAALQRRSRPGGLALPAGEDLAAVASRADDLPPGRAPGDLPALGAGLSSLPAWVAAGVATGLLGRADLAVVLTLGGAALAVGAGLAWLVVGERGPWWAGAGTAGVAVALPAALVAGGLLIPARAVAVVLTLWLAVSLALPWFVTRSRTWTDPRQDAADLVAHAEATRRTLDVGALAGATAAAVGMVLLAASAVGGAGVDGSGGVMVLGFVVAVSLAALLRARRSMFVVESAALVGAGTVGLAAVGWAEALIGGPAARGLVVAAIVVAVGVLVALGGALRAGSSGDDRVVAWWHRPRTQRLLGWLETAAAVAVLPLLAGVLGVYLAAADAGARL